MVSPSQSRNHADPAPLVSDIEFYCVDLAELVRASCAPFGALAAERELVFQVQAPTRTLVPCDGEKIERVVLHLLFNAFKQAPRRGTIAVLLGVDEAAGTAVIAVRNDGPAVAAEAEESLFAAGRGDGHHLVVSDWLGFDLASTRASMEQHGGSLDIVRDPPGGGAEFRARLPLLLSSIARAGLAGWSPSSLISRRVARAATEELHVEERVNGVEPITSDRPQVLVVEGPGPDDRAIGAALAATCQVLSASAGDALDQALRSGPSLMIADLTLAGIDGRQFVARVRAAMGQHAMPMLALIAADDPALAVDLLAAGVQDVMRKPVLMAELTARADNLLEARRATDVLGALVGQHQADLVKLAADVTTHQRRLEAVLVELRAARCATETASRIKSNFLRMMSHELKTPVTSLVLQLQLFELDGLGDSSSETASGFKSMARSISRLLHIVDTILEWARIESGRFRAYRSDLDLVDVANRAVVECRHIAAGKGLLIELETTSASHPARQDARLVELVLINVLERAITVSHAGIIEVRLSQRDDGHLISVRDRGTSLTATERAELLEPLQPHIDVARSGGSGSGLGLAVARDLARAAGGDLSVGVDDNVIELRL
jgi:signal transduction histidine kinase